MKKIVVIGASGVIGKAIVEQLGLRHEVITVGFHLPHRDQSFGSSLMRMLRKDTVP